MRLHSEVALSSIQERLDALGIVLPPPSKPAANYVPWRRVGDLVYIAGQVPVVDGDFAWIGKVGRDYSTEEGKECARVVGAAQPGAQPVPVLFLKAPPPGLEHAASVGKGDGARGWGG